MVTDNKSSAFQANDYVNSNNLKGLGINNSIYERRQVKIQNGIAGESETITLDNGSCINGERKDSERIDVGTDSENPETNRPASVKTADIHSEPISENATHNSKVPYVNINPSTDSQLSTNPSTAKSLPTTAATEGSPKVPPPNATAPPTVTCPTSIGSFNSLANVTNDEEERADFPADSKGLAAVEAASLPGEDLSVDAWQKISILICAFVILREFHPIESYFVKYLETLDTNYTRDVVRRSIYPVGTYSSLLLMVITFLITDYTRYKPIVILDVLAGLLSYVLILNDPPLPVMWVQQVCIGFYHAGEVSYYSYMYSKIKNKSCYQRATGRVKASIMIGRFISGMSGQSVILLFGTAGYKILVYLSILGMAGATIWTCLLPPVEDSVYFHQTPATENSRLTPSSGRSLARVVKIIWADFKAAFSQVEILKWSVWWVLGMGGYILVITYNQVLWASLVQEDPVNNQLMNGAVDAVFPIAGAISTFSIAKVSLDWSRYGEVMLALGTLIQGSLLVLSHSCHSLKLVYLYYIVFGCIHYTMLTIASSEIAKCLKRESFALVFGFNKFIALLSVSVFTLLVVQVQNTPTRTLYLLFGVYFISIGVTYCTVSICRTLRSPRSTV